MNALRPFRDVTRSMFQVSQFLLFFSFSFFSSFFRSVSNSVISELLLLKDSRLQVAG